MHHIHFDVTNSTNTQAAALAKQYADQPLLVTAGAQTAGRGRTGRPWHSPPGGAWFTVAWPTDSPLLHTAPAPVAVGLAVHDAVAEVLAAPAADRTGHNREQARHLTIKWPNDVLLNERKVAGILCEQGVQLASDRRTLLLGVGINANLDVTALGDDLRQSPIALRDVLGCTVQIDALIQSCAANIAEAMARLEAHGGLDSHAVQRINRLLAWRGRSITLQRGQAHIKGMLEGIDARGRALIDRNAYEAGEVQTLTPTIHQTHA